MYVIVWRFEIRPESVAAFERAYGSEGDWARFFRRSPHFLGTTLLGDLGSPHVYVTLDRWDSEADFEAFRREHATEYAAIDRACERLTLAETRLGAFVSATPYPPVPASS